MQGQSINLKRAILTGGAWSLSSAGVYVCISFVSTITLSRLLRPEDFGIFALSEVASGLFSSCPGLGIGAALVQEQNLSKEEQSSAFWLYILVSLPIFILVTAASPLMSFFFDNNLFYKLIPFSAFTYIVMAPGTIYSWFLEKDLEFAFLAKSEIFVDIISAISTIGLAYLGFGVWSLAWGKLIHCTLISALYTFYGFSKWTPMFHFRWNSIKKFVDFGLYQMGEGTILNLNYYLDKILIGYLLGVKELGFYEFVSKRLVPPLIEPSSVFLRNAFPILAKLQYDLSSLRSVFISLTKILNSIDAPLLIGIAILAPIIIPSIFGFEWTLAAPLVPMIAVASFLRRTNSQTSILLLATGKPAASFRLNLIMVITSSIAIIPGALYYGATGVASALALSMGICSFFGYFKLIRPTIGECGKFMITAFLKPAMVAILISIAIKFFITNSNFEAKQLIILCIAGIICYSGILWIIERKLVQAAD